MGNFCCESEAQLPAHLLPQKPLLYGNYFDTNSRTILTALTLAQINVDFKPVHIIGFDQLLQSSNELSIRTTNESSVNSQPLINTFASQPNVYMCPSGDMPCLVDGKMRVFGDLPILASYLAKTRISFKECMFPVQLPSTYQHGVIKKNLGKMMTNSNYQSSNQGPTQNPNPYQHQSTSEINIQNSQITDQQQALYRAQQQAVYISYEAAMSWYFCVLKPVTSMIIEAILDDVQKTNKFKFTTQRINDLKQSFHEDCLGQLDQMLQIPQYNHMPSQIGGGGPGKSFLCNAEQTPSFVDVAYYTEVSTVLTLQKSQSVNIGVQFPYLSQWLKRMANLKEVKEVDAKFRKELKTLGID